MSGYTVTLSDREYDALKDRIRTLESDLAATEKQGTAAHEACVGYEARIRTLEAALRRVRHCAATMVTDPEERGILLEMIDQDLPTHPPAAPTQQAHYTDSDDVPRGSVPQRD